MLLLELIGSLSLPFLSRSLYPLSSLSLLRSLSNSLSLSPFSPALSTPFSLSPLSPSLALKLSLSPSLARLLSLPPSLSLARSQTLFLPSLSFSLSLPLFPTLAIKLSLFLSFARITPALAANINQVATGRMNTEIYR